MDVKSYVCLAAVLVMSAVLFCLMGIDKRLAVTHRRRVSEKTLFSFAALFGAPGGLLGMYVFHHSGTVCYNILYSQVKKDHGNRGKKRNSRV